MKITLRNVGEVVIETDCDKAKPATSMTSENRSSINYKKPKGKESYFIKYIKKFSPGTIIELDDFYKEYPKHKTNIGCKKRVEKMIAVLIQDKKLMQLGNSRFKVLK